MKRLWLQMNHLGQLHVSIGRVQVDVMTWMMIALLLALACMPL